MGWELGVTLKSQYLGSYLWEGALASQGEGPGPPPPEISVSGNILGQLWPWGQAGPTGDVVS